VGEDPVEDAKWFHVTPGGVTLITEEMIAKWHAAQ
jgi:glucose-1-phosphate adenylyltransferase